ncbi:two-component regulator propeller domain-containing protein [Luteibacter sp. CQ10]|uniref:two-component regulator propeller domain-containing protein n=1 Tax=Luteibacter sp. CQ10 TaxID=2805821 RepID=UPI0034A58F0A
MARVMLAIALWLAMPLAASATEEAHPSSTLLHTAYRREDGAPSGVSFIAQTEDGQLWFSTRTGLYRYDGFDFTRITLRPPGSPRTDATWALYAAKGGDLWVSQANGGAVRLRQGTLQRYDEADGLPANISIDAFAGDADGRIWANARGVLYRYDGQAWSPAPSSPPDVIDLIEDRQGNLWASSGTQWFVLRPHAAAFMASGVHFDKESYLLDDPSGRLWMLDEKGAAPLPGEWGRPHPPARARRANSATRFIDRAGALWTVACKSGLCRDLAFSLHGSAFRPSESFRDANDLPALELSSQAVMTALEDREGNVWLGTKGGVDLLREGALTRINLPAFPLYFSPFEDAQGRMWTGTDNHNPTPDHLWNLSGTPSALPGFDEGLTMAYTDSRGGTWLGGHGRLWRMNDGKIEETSFPAAKSGAPGVVQAMGRDATGRLWLSVAFQGLYRADAGGPWISAGDELPPGSPMVIHVDHDGMAWFGYADGSLIRAQGDTFHRVLPGPNLEIGAITAIDSVEGCVYASGEHGFAVIDGDRVERITTSPAGVLEGATGIGTRSDDTIWVNAESGIAWLAHADIQRALRDGSRHVDVNLLTADDGVTDGVQTVRPLPTLAATRDGTLWFARAESLLRLDAGRLPPMPSPPATVIRSVSSVNQNFPLDDIRLDPAHRDFIVRYAAIAPGRPSGVRFRYRMDPGMTIWTSLDRQRELRYTQMHPGEYHLTVEASYDGRRWGRPAEAVLTVVPTFFEGPWFKLLCGMIVALAIWLAHRLRVRGLTRQLRVRLRERYEERERIARELHDTLLQGAQGLVLRFQAIVDRLPDTDGGKHSLEQAIDRAERLIVEGRDRVQDLREHMPYAGTLADRLRRYGDDLENLGVQIVTQTRGTPRALDPLAEDELYYIGREALLNVQRHADARSVTIEMIFTSRLFTLVIRDDGKGIDPRSTMGNDGSRHWGLTGIRERARRIGGQADIHPGADKGTELRIGIPSSRAYRRDA